MSIITFKVHENIIVVLKMRRIFAGSLTAVLLCASSWAAACDLSCGFMSFPQECHSPQSKVLDKEPSDLETAGMTMPGMDMSGMSDNTARNQPTIPGASRKRVDYPSMRTMGPCAQQSCDQIPAVAAKAAHKFAPQAHMYFVISESSQDIRNRQAVFRGPWDKTTSSRLCDRNLLAVSLRI
jgi:hypothetical protein